MQMQLHLRELSVGMSTSKAKQSLLQLSEAQERAPNQLLSSRYPQLLRANHALHLQRHTQTRFDNAVTPREQLQQQITMFKSLKSSWTNHPLLQDDFCKI